MLNAHFSGDYSKEIKDLNRREYEAILKHFEDAGKRSYKPDNKLIKQVSSTVSCPPVLELRSHSQGIRVFFVSVDKGLIIDLIYKKGGGGEHSEKRLQGKAIKKAQISIARFQNRISQSTL